MFSFEACPHGWTVYNRKCFKWTETGPIPGSEARAQCSQMLPGAPAYLVRPDSTDEEQFVLSLIRYDG